jgi:glycosyltransferase involved in cell wall biosynthesis
VTVETMQHGLPVEAFADCPAIEELVLDGETCLLAPATPDRAASFAKSLDWLMSDEALRHRLGASGQERVTGKYDLEAICDTWEGLLTSVESC